MVLAGFVVVVGDDDNDWSGCAEELTTTSTATSDSSCVRCSGTKLSTRVIHLRTPETIQIAGCIGAYLSLKSRATSSNILVSTSRGSRIPPNPDLHSFTTEGGRFSNLCHFGFRTVNLMTAADIVESMACWFENLNIPITRRSTLPVMTETIRSLRRMTEVLSRHQSSASLSQLTLHVFPDMVTGGESVHSALRPLFRLNGINNLRLHLPIFDEVGDSWLDEASQSWPHLETLQVAPPYGQVAQRDGGPTMTLAGLIPLLNRCPNLGQLEISLIAKPIDAGLLSSISSSTLYVTFSDSTIESPSEVFRCIVLMFPQLRQFNGFSSGYLRWGLDEDVAWRELCHLISQAIQVPNGTPWSEQA